ncbi:hypothetical protein ACYJ2U_001663 [Clostridium botulinum]
MKEVDVDLYEFLKNNETTILEDKYGLEVVAFVDFDNLEEFVKIIGTYYFDEKGLEVIMRDSYLCIPIKDHIEGCGHRISSYKNCFENDTWRRFGEEIKKLEKEGEL